MLASAPQGFLERHHTVGLDTSVVIYAVEGNAKYSDLAHEIFSWLQARGKAVTSTLTMTEVLVRPYRLQDIDAVDRFYALLRSYPHLDWIPPTLQIADRAAQIRADYNLRTPDAIQAAPRSRQG